MVIDSSRGKVTATFLNGEIVFHGIAQREKQKLAETEVVRVPRNAVTTIPGNPATHSDKSGSDYSKETRGKSTGTRVRKIPRNRTIPTNGSEDSGKSSYSENLPRRLRGRKVDQRVIDFSERFFRKTCRPPSGSEIKAEFPELPTSTAYDYAARARAVEIGKRVNINDNAFASLHEAGNA
jgi:hypothetical protein